MAHVVTEACIGVKGEGCIAVCPELCILTEPVDDMAYIDPARCTDCGVCVAACVVGAIFPATELPAPSTEFTHINASWHRHKNWGTRARARDCFRDGLVVTSELIKVNPGISQN